jgi:hypothetical protein
MCMPPCNATVQLLVVLYCSTAGGLAVCSLFHGDDDIHAYLVTHAYLCMLENMLEIIRSLMIMCAQGIMM